MRLFSVCALAFAAASSASAGIVDIPGLQSITVWERTGGSGPTPNTFGRVASQLFTRAGVLNGGSADFIGTSTEFYDVYYSDADGTPNPAGNWLTIDCVYEHPLGGGCNIADVQLNFFTGPSEFASVVTNIRSGGIGAFPSSAPFAVDGDLLTHTTLGTGGNASRLGITVSFASVPAPGVGGLIGLAALAGLRRRR